MPKRGDDENPLLVGEIYRRVQNWWDKASQTRREQLLNIKDSDLEAVCQIVDATLTERDAKTIKRLFANDEAAALARKLCKFKWGYESFTFPTWNQVMSIHMPLYWKWLVITIIDDHKLVFGSSEMYKVNEDDIEMINACRNKDGDFDYGPAAKIFFPSSHDTIERKFEMSPKWWNRSYKSFELPHNPIRPGRNIRRPNFLIEIDNATYDNIFYNITTMKDNHITLKGGRDFSFEVNSIGILIEALITRVLYLYKPYEHGSNRYKSHDIMKELRDVAFPNSPHIEDIDVRDETTWTPVFKYFVRLRKHLIKEEIHYAKRTANDLAILPEWRLKLKDDTIRTIVKDFQAKTFAHVAIQMALDMFPLDNLSGVGTILRTCKVMGIDFFGERDMRWLVRHYIEPILPPGEPSY